MKKIHVIPHEGYTVRDHKGDIIPADGAEVVESKVVLSRIREGLLILVEDEEEATDPPPAGEDDAGEGDDSPPAGGDETDEEVDDGADGADGEDEGLGEEADDDAVDGGSIEPGDMTRKELMALLTEYGVAYKANDSKEALVELVFQHLGEAE